jgi:hypothetical protein
MVHDLVEHYIKGSSTGKSKNNAATELKKSVSHIILLLVVSPYVVVKVVVCVTLTGVTLKKSPPIVAHRLLSSPAWVRQIGF